MTSPDKGIVPFSHAISLSKQSKVPSFSEVSNSSFFATDPVATSLPSVDAGKASLVALHDPLVSLVARENVMDSSCTDNDYDFIDTLKPAKEAPHRDTSSTPISGDNPSCKSLSKEVLSRMVSLTTTRSLDNKAKYIVPKFSSCSKTLPDELVGAAVGPSTKLQPSKLNASSTESTSSSKSHCNQEVTRTTTSKGQVDIVQCLEPGLGRELLSRNIVTIDQLTAITKGLESKRTSINDSFHRRRANPHCMHVSRTTPSMGSKKHEKQLPNLTLPATKRPHGNLNRTIVTLPDSRTNKVCLPSVSLPRESKRKARLQRESTKQKDKVLHRRNELKITPGIEDVCMLCYVINTHTSRYVKHE